MHRGNDAETMTLLHPPKDRMKGEISSECMQRTLFCTVLECSAVLSCSELTHFKAFQKKDLDICSNNGEQRIRKDCRKDQMANAKGLALTAVAVS